MSDVLTRVHNDIQTRITALEHVSEELRRLRAALKALENAEASGPQRASRRKAIGASVQTRGRAGRRSRSSSRETILEIVANRPDASPSEIASAAGVARPTVYRTLRVLVADGIVEKRAVGGVAGYHLTRT